MTSSQTTAKAPRTRPLSGLRKYLKGAAPTLSAQRLRQSRRIEGQLSGDGDKECFSEVVVALPLGAGVHESALQAISKAIAVFQRDQRRGPYRLRLVVYGGQGRPEEQCSLGDISQGPKLARWLKDQAGDTPTVGLQLDELPRPDRGALVVIAQSKANNAVSQPVIDKLARHPRKQIVWAQLDEDCFSTGRLAPAVAPTSTSAPAMSATTPHPVSVVGYSERGMVNGLVAYLRQDASRVADFIEAIKWTQPAGGLPDDGALSAALQSPWSGGLTVTYIVESSFAQFGDPDLIVVVQGAEARWLFFVEAKVVSYAHSAMQNRLTMRRPGFNSSINGQLSLRYRLARALAGRACDSKKQGGDLIEPSELWAKARQVPDSGGLGDPSGGPRKLAKPANLTHLVPAMVGTTVSASPADFMDRVYFVALTHEARGQKLSFPTDHHNQLAPRYFVGAGGAAEIEETAWRHTGFCSWIALEEHMPDLVQSPDYAAVRRMLSDPVTPHLGFRPGRNTLRPEHWADHLGLTWMTDRRAQLDAVFEDVRDSLVGNCRLSLSKRTGSDSWSANGVVVVKVMPHTVNDTPLLLVGLACDLGHEIPAHFQPDESIGERALSGRRFLFATVDEQTTAKEFTIFQSALQGYINEVASGQR